MVGCGRESNLVLDEIQTMKISIRWTCLDKLNWRNKKLFISEELKFQTYFGDFLGD
jgi:hypothetical protein